MAESSQEIPILKLGPGAKDQIIYFFGAYHTNNPEDPQFDNLKKIWGEFLLKSGVNKTAFVEGATREIPEAYEEAIREYGEAGALQWLAHGRGIGVSRPELGEREQRQLLSNTYYPELVAYTVIAQNLAGWLRHTKKESFQDALARVLGREAKFSDIYNFNLNGEWFESKHKELFGSQGIEDKTFLDSITDPRKKNTVINEIVASRSALRNKYLLEVIANAWKNGESIFIVYGKGHLASLESELQSLVKE